MNTYCLNILIIDYQQNEEVNAPHGNMNALETQRELTFCLLVNKLVTFDIIFVLKMQCFICHTTLPFQS